MSIRRIFEFIKSLHSTSSPIYSMFGTMYGGSKDFEFYDRNNKFSNNIFENLIICSPEAAIGGVVCYYWVYTLPILSFYHKYKIYKDMS